MSTTWVAFHCNGETTKVGAGGIIGRLASAALRIDDSRVSEAHALVSRRGKELKLLALRRWFEVDGERASEVALRPGQHIRLAPGVKLEVGAVQMADHILVVLGGALGRIELEGGVYSIVRCGSGVQMEPGYAAEALGRVWSTGEGWACRVGEEPVVELGSGTELCFGDAVLRVKALATHEARSTAGNPGLDPPLRIVIRHDSVHLFRPACPPVVLSGVPARLLSEVAILGAPSPWEVPAREIWRSEVHRHVVRQNWDRNNRSLRAKLAAAGIRTDLVRADGRGNVELFLLPLDELVDET